MKALAILLVLAAALFVALVIIPQTQQAQRAEANMRSGASALLGTWIPDGEGMWELTCIRPRVAKKLADLTADAIERLKVKFLANITLVSLPFTADRIISSGPGYRSEIIYKIRALDGDVFTLDTTDSTGRPNQSKVTVTTDGLVIFDHDNPDAVLAFHPAQ